MWRCAPWSSLALTEENFTTLMFLDAGPTLKHFCPPRVGSIMKNITPAQQKCQPARQVDRQVDRHSGIGSGAGSRSLPCGGPWLSFSHAVPVVVVP